MARLIFVDGWNQRHRQTVALAKSLKTQAAKIEKQIAQVLDRILDAESGEVASIYEKRMAKLEREKIALMERAKESTCTKATFDEMLEQAMNFLANPWKLWDGGDITLRRCVLRLAFEDKITYSREKRLRAPEISIPFKALEGILALKKKWCRIGDSNT